MTFLRPKKLVLVILASALCIACAVGATALASSPGANQDSRGRLRVGPVARTTTQASPFNPSAWLSEANALMIANWYAEERAAEERAAQERAEAESASPKISAAGDRATQPPPPASAASGDCANPVVPEAVARRESGCNWQVVNPGGCSGRSCLGFFQLDAGHFYAVSPWNPNVSGACYGLGDWHDPAVQIACASRLGPGAWG